MKGNHEILIVSDSENYDHEHILQITSKARELADKCDMKVSVLCVGREDEKKFKKLMEHGADTVILSEQDYAPGVRALADVSSGVIRERNPAAVLFPATNTGKNVAAVLSVRFGAGLTADCIEIEATEDGDFYFYRAAINDSVVAKISCINCDIRMCTVKKNVFLQRTRTGGEGALERFDFKTRPEEMIRLLGSVMKKRAKTVDIGAYRVVFCMGRGVKTTEMRDRIAELARKCGAGIVGTRAVVEEKLIEKELQVGQSGKSIAPQIYVGFGVSGASQHMVGIKNSDVIIAVNNDRDAAIFDYADYTIEEDIDVIVGEMEEALCRMESDEKAG